MEFFNVKKIQSLSKKLAKESEKAIAKEREIARKKEIERAKRLAQERELKRIENERKREKKRAKVEKARKIREQQEKKLIARRIEHQILIDEEVDRQQAIRRAAVELQIRSGNISSSGSVPLRAMYRCGRK